MVYCRFTCNTGAASSLKSPTQCSSHHTNASVEGGAYEVGVCSVRFLPLLHHMVNGAVMFSWGSATDVRYIAFAVSLYAGWILMYGVGCCHHVVGCALL